MDSVNDHSAHLHIVILAAGWGRRMGSAKAKVMHKMGGKSLLQHVIDTAKSLQPQSVHIVINPRQSKVDLPNDSQINWVEQHQAKGTGHALRMALPQLPASGTLLGFIW